VVTIRCKNWRGVRLSKDGTRNFFLTEIKNMWNAGTGALKSRGIALKSDISFVFEYLNKCVSLSSFLTYPRINVIRQALKFCVFMDLKEYATFLHVTYSFYNVK
jgi:hypothetical protein